MLHTIALALIGFTKLTCRLAWISPHLLFKRKRAMKVFQAQLQASGLDKCVAKELTESYKQLGNFKQWLEKIPNK